MTFPSDHRFPGGLPRFIVAGHDFQHIGVAEDIAFERGEDRSRQIYTFNPQLVRVSSAFSQAQFDTFDAWFEADLLAGANRFDVQVAEQGGVNTAWWASQFVGPYRWRYVNGAGIYEVTAELLLLDGPYATRTAPGLRGSMTLTTILRGQLANDSALRGSMTLTTTLRARLAPPALAGTMTLTTELTGYLGANPDDLLAEDGQQRINEFGSRRTLE